MPNVLVMQVDCEPAAMLGRYDEMAAFNLREKLMEVFGKLPCDESVEFRVWKQHATEEEIQTRQDW